MKSFVLGRMFGCDVVFKGNKRDVQRMTEYFLEHFIHFAPYWMVKKGKI